jgi:broad specificity phosphatase PhoE
MNDLIYLVRHGETEWNCQGRRQGRKDSSLTPRGTAQAVAYAEWLRAQPNATDLRIRSSPLGRALDTAQIIRSSLQTADDRFHIDEDLAEFDYGSWAGLVDAEVEARFPGQLARRESDKWNYQVPGGESYAQMAQRIGGWLRAQVAEEQLIVVAHEMVSRLLRGLYLGMSTNEILALRHPQTDVFILSGGAITRVGVGA